MNKLIERAIAPFIKMDNVGCFSDEDIKNIKAAAKRPIAPKFNPKFVKSDHEALPYISTPTPVTEADIQKAKKTVILGGPGSGGARSGAGRPKGSSIDSVSGTPGVNGSKDMYKAFAKLTEGNEHQGPVYKYMVENGKQFNEVDIKASKEFAAQNGSKLGECFKNAQLGALVSPEKYDYYDGHAMVHSSDGKPLVPVEHAWMVDKQSGKVIDPTWVKSTGGIKGADYFGLRIPYKDVMASITKTGTAQPLSNMHAAKLAGVLK